MTTRVPLPRFAVQVAARLVIAVAFAVPCTAVAAADAAAGVAVPAGGITDPRGTILTKGLAVAEAAVRQAAAARSTSASGGNAAPKSAASQGKGSKGKSAAPAAADKLGETSSTPQVATPNPHGSFKDDCAKCHRADSWTPAKPTADFDHSKYGFALDGSHKDVPCLQCHKSLEFSTTNGSKCADCHQDIHEGEMGIDCARCHSTRDFVDRAEAVRKHRLFRFPLTGAHVTTDCAGCHTPQGGSSMKFAGTPETCDACHHPDYMATTAPDHSTSGFSTDCASCHTTASFSGGAFDHSATRFPLTGAHAGVSCAQCHGEGTPAALPTDCASCHRADYDATAEPPHLVVGFPTDCASCHGTAAWEGASFDHASTGFTLTGAHTATDCASCHGGTPGVAPASACVSCHRPDYDATTAPVHSAVGFPTECQTCHGTASWDGASFDHATTGFPLTGQHTGQDCAACHGSGSIGALDPACVGCHRDEYDATTDPDHADVGFATECAQCHGTSAWTGATFDHNTTGFALTGAHTVTSCAQCHGGVTGPPPNQCVGCHRADYDATTTPNHASTGFPTDCVQCHGTTSWAGASFDHSVTGFPLTGQHVGQSCTACHGSGPIGHVDPACVTCHRSEYDATTDPDHAQVGFDTDCASCHNTSGWPGATFNHNTTGFPLTGAHTVTSCAQCHGGVTGPPPNQCVGCHRADYDGTTSPNHASSGFPTDCVQCHGTASWDGASFDHSITGFPLTGQHVGQSCTACHGTGPIGHVDPECVSCHRAEYDATTDPDHAQVGMSTDCAGCHSTAAWTGATFDHNTTGFPLTGQHVTTDCASCHGGTSPPPSECVGCHLGEYNGTTDPPHAGAGFPTTCQTCHGTNQWAGATFDHDGPYFPIYSGRHNGEWSTCADCHTQPTDYSAFECIFCHEHNQSSMDSKHRGRSGYSYNSAACYRCHPRGRS